MSQFSDATLNNILQLAQTGQWAAAYQHYGQHYSITGT